MEVLQKHANKTNTTTQLDEAVKSALLPKSTLREKIARKQSILTSFRRSTREGDKNNILTAVHVYDDILGGEKQSLDPRSISGNYNRHICSYYRKGHSKLPIVRTTYRRFLGSFINRYLPTIAQWDKLM